jgi:outer membrane protein assembly factor BamB
VALVLLCGCSVEDDSLPIVAQPAVAAIAPESNRTSGADVPDLAARRQGDDWPAFLGPTADSKSRETGILTAWNSSPPRIVWQQPLGTSYGAPTISRGRLFQFCRYGKAARLTAMRSETGEELWKFEYPTDYEDLYGYNNGPRCSPVVDDDRVYILGAEGMLHCLRVVDGKLLWKHDTQDEYGVVQNFFGVGSAPVVYRDLLIVQIGGSGPQGRAAPPGRLDVVDGNGSGVVAFDKHSGEEKYRITNELASYAGPVLATIGDRDWCFVLARGGLVGFEPASGKVDFHYPWRAELLESVNASNPVVVDDLVFISETYGPGSSLLRVRPGGYEVVWSDEKRPRDKRMQTHWNTAVHHEGYLYGSSGRHANNAELRCIELKTGEIQWSEPGLSRSSLMYVDGHFLCLTEYCELLLLKANPKKFEQVAKLELQDRPPAWAAPVLSHGLLYVRGNDRLTCYELIPEKK